MLATAPTTSASLRPLAVSVDAWPTVPVRRAPLDPVADVEDDAVMETGFATAEPDAEVLEPWATVAVTRPFFRFEAVAAELAVTCAAELVILRAVSERDEPCKMSAALPVEATPDAPVEEPWETSIDLRACLRFVAVELDVAEIEAAERPCLAPVAVDAVVREAVPTS